MANDLVIVGCGGFGREVVGIVDAINATSSESEQWNLIGFLDDSPSATNLELVARLSLPMLGPVDSSSLPSATSTHFVVGIGSSSARRNVAQIAGAMGMIPATLIHPSASIGRDVRMGAGTIVAARSHVTTNVTLGAHVHIDRAGQIGHDSSLGDFSTIHPMAVVSGNCRIGDGAELGTNCTLLPGVKVGMHAVVGAGACVVKDVDESVVVKGIPAR